MENLLVKILFRKLVVLNCRPQLVQEYLDLIHDKRVGVTPDEFLNGVTLQYLADGRKLLQDLAIRGHASIIQESAGAHRLAPFV